MPDRADDLQVPTPLRVPTPRLTPAAWSDTGDAWEADTHDAELRAIPAGTEQTGTRLRFPKSRYATEDAARAALRRLYPSLADSAANPDGTYNLYSRMLFSEGTWNGEPYTADDLKEMVRAHGEIGHELRPWAALGHDPEQEYAKSHGLPRVGSVTNLRVAPHEKDPSKTALYGDILNVPEPVYRAVEQKGYPTRSPEIYHDLNWNGHQFPRVFRALALLGTEEAGNPTMPDLFRAYDRAEGIEGDLRVYAFQADGEEVHDALTPPAQTPSQSDDPERLARVQRAYAARAGELVPGLPLRITYPAGSLRSGTDRAGRPWTTAMQADYASVPDTVGADGDALDVYLGPQAAQADTAYVVAQHDPQTGEYDEDKTMIGWPDLLAARDAYLAHMPDPAALGAIRAVPLGDWIAGALATRSVPATPPPEAPPTEAAQRHAPDLTAAAQAQGRIARTALSRVKARMALGRSQAVAGSDALRFDYSFDPSQPRDASGKWASEGDQAAYHALKALDSDGAKQLGHQLTAKFALAKHHLKGGDLTAMHHVLGSTLPLLHKLKASAEAADAQADHAAAYSLYHTASHYGAIYTGLGMTKTDTTITAHPRVSVAAFLGTPVVAGTTADFMAADHLWSSLPPGATKDAVHDHKTALAAALDGKAGKAAFWAEGSLKKLKALDPASLNPAEQKAAHALAQALGSDPAPFAPPTPKAAAPAQASPQGGVAPASVPASGSASAVHPSLESAALPLPQHTWQADRRGRAAYHAQAVLAAMAAGDGAAYDEHLKALDAVRGLFTVRYHNSKKAGDTADADVARAHETHLRDLVKRIKADFKIGGVTPDTQEKVTQLGPAGQPHNSKAATSAPVAPQTAPAPAPAPAITGLSVKAHGDVAHTNPVSTGQGSNGATFYDGKDGKKYVVKKYASPEQAYNEHVSNQIYAALSIPVANTHLTDVGAHASEVLENSQALNGMQGITKKQAQEFLGGFMGDVALSNWDVIGTGGGQGENKGGDNLRVGSDGRLYRIDNGGSLLFRAAAGKKPTGFHEKLSELENFMSLNPQYATMMHRAGVGHWSDIPDIAEQANRVVAALSDTNIQALTAATPGVTAAQQEQLRQILQKRRELVAQVPAYIAKHKAEKALAQAQSGSVNTLVAKTPSEIAALASSGQLPHHAKASLYAADLAGIQAVKSIAAASPSTTAANLLAQAEARAGGMLASVGPAASASMEQHYLKLKNHVTACHVTAEHKAVKIITQGGFKTIMEPGTTGGGGDSFQSKGRITVEQKAFKIWKGDKDGKNAPIYCAVAPALTHTPPPPFKQTSLGYGGASPVIFDLHPHVLERSTFYRTDSADHYHTPTDSTKKLLNKDEAAALYAAREATGNHGNGYGFIECHPTGGVMMEDVRALRVTDKDRATRMRKTLDAAGYTNLPIYIEAGGKITHHSGVDAR